MPQQTQPRKVVQTALIAEAQSEPAFRQALLNNAKAAIEKAFGVVLPAGAEWKVLEETSTTNYLVLPATAEDELSDADLEAVAGGWTTLVLAMQRTPVKARYNQSETLASSVEKKDAETNNAVVGKI